MRSSACGCALVLLLAGCGAGNNGAATDGHSDLPSHVDAPPASDADGPITADGPHADGAPDDVATDTGSPGDAADAAGGSDARDAPGDATSDLAPVDSRSDGGPGTDAAADAPVADAPVDAPADAPTDRPSSTDGGSDGGVGDAGTDGPTFSSTTGAGVVRSYASALWARSGHPSLIESLDWSRDGGRVVTASYDKTIRVFDAHTGNLQRIMMAPGPNYAVAWSADGAWIVTGDNQATARLWDGATGTGVRTFSGHKNEVSAVTFCPDGATVATGGWDATVVLWARDTGAVRQVLSHPGWIYGLAYSPNGQLLASAGSGSGASGSIRLWNPQTGELVREIFSPTPMPGADTMSGLAFSPDGTLLLTGGYQNVGRIFKVATGELVTTLTGHGNWIWTVGWNAAGTRALTASWDGTIRLWDTPGYALHQVISTTLMSSLRLEAAAFNPTADELASSDGPGGTVRVWDGATGAAVRELTGTAGPVWSVAYSPDGTRLASAGGDGVVRLWNAADGTQTGRIAAGGYLRAVAWSPTGDRVAVVGNSGAGGIWNATTLASAAGVLSHGDRTNAIAWSPNGNLVASGGSDQLVSIHDLAAGTYKTMSGHTGEVTGVAFSPDGKWLASVAFYREVKIWDASTGALVKSLMGGITGSADAVAFSPDGSVLAVAVNQNTGLVQLWNTSTWLTTKALASSTMPIEGLAFSRDGLRLVTGAQDQSVRVWTLATGAQVTAFTGTFARVHRVDFAADGTHVAFGDDLGTLAVIPAQ
jgi:WD40 repeat protein